MLMIFNLSNTDKGQASVPVGDIWRDKLVSVHLGKYIQRIRGRIPTVGK